MLLDALEVLVVIGALFWLYAGMPKADVHGKPATDSGWRVLWPATVTPLASIIGSGFLVSGPLLVSIYGDNAPLAMIIVVVVAYLLGQVMRFNILYAEPLLRYSSQPALTGRQVLPLLETLASVALTLAYFISVAFYIRLMAAFVLQLFGIYQPLASNALATLILGFIAWVGWFRNLQGLEFLERHAVNIKLSIILALLVSLALVYYGHRDLAEMIDGFRPADSRLFSFTNLSALAGILLIVQGFETSRYLGAHYSPEVRIRSMKLAQLVSGVIYCLFILWSGSLFEGFDGALQETEIIVVVGKISSLLPYLLTLAAVLSQFSAAVADTLASGGLQARLFRDTVSEPAGYVIVCVLAIALIWGTDLFSIITLASRAFAAYYLIQCLIALAAAYQQQRPLRQWVVPMLMLGIMIFVVLFATPVAA